MEPKGPHRRFGAALNAAVRASGRRKVPLAAQLGVNKATLSRWLNGHIMPTPSAWRPVAARLEALGIDTAPVVAAIGAEYGDGVAP